MMIVIFFSFQGDEDPNDHEKRTNFLQSTEIGITGQNDVSNNILELPLNLYISISYLEYTYLQ